MGGLASCSLTRPSGTLERGYEWLATNCEVGRRCLVVVDSCRDLVYGPVTAASLDTEVSIIRGLTRNDHPAS